MGKERRRYIYAKTKTKREKGKKEYAKTESKRRWKNKRVKDR
jgi:hypothetical protein